MDRQASQDQVEVAHGRLQRERFAARACSLGRKAEPSRQDRFFNESDHNMAQNGSKCCTEHVACEAGRRKVTLEVKKGRKDTKRSKRNPSLDLHWDIH